MKYYYGHRNVSFYVITTNVKLTKKTAWHGEFIRYINFFVVCGFRQEPLANCNDSGVQPQPQMSVLR
jgi:hypothetical protein